MVSPRFGPFSVFPPPSRYQLNQRSGPFPICPPPLYQLSPMLTEILRFCNFAISAFPLKIIPGLGSHLVLLRTTLTFLSENDNSLSLSIDSVITANKDFLPKIPCRCKKSNIVVKFLPDQPDCNVEIKVLNLQRCLFLYFK